MVRRFFDFDQPERFVAGTVGEPGQRAFFLQARQAGALVSVALEKVQVSALADRLTDLLEFVEEDGDGSGSPPPRSVPAEEGPLDEAPLEEPLVELFRVGLLALAWDPAGGRVVIEAQPQVDEEADDDAGEGTQEAAPAPDALRVHIDPAQAHAFVRRAHRLVEAGRPACPFCGEPLEPTGHFCVQSNGRLN